MVTEAIEAATVLTYTGPELVLSKLPLIVWAASPGYMAASTVVWLTVRADVEAAVLALPLPLPVVLQYAKAAAPAPSTITAPITGTVHLFLCFIMRGYGLPVEG